MDNLTHALVGAALGQAGLKRKSGLGMIALVIGANLPDVDVVFALFGDGLSMRRGWTHGPVGILVLPAILTFLLVWFDRWQARRGVRPQTRLPVLPGQLLLLAYIGALTHPLLDLMNNWGIRLLMPFSERWFYGDTLFIVDPLIWLALGIGIWLSRRRERIGGPSAPSRLPSVIALGVTVFYTAFMAGTGRFAENEAAVAFAEAGHGRPAEVLANPVALNPFRRDIVIRTADQYGFGEFDWLYEPRVRLDAELLDSQMGRPEVRRAVAEDPRFADYLRWSRFPFAEVTLGPGGSRVDMADARFTRVAKEGLLSVSIELPPQTMPRGVDLDDP